MRQLEAVILETLIEQQAVHVVDLARQINEHPVAVDQACARLNDQGYLTLSNHGIYDVTDQGRNQLDKLEHLQGK